MKSLRKYKERPWVLRQGVPVSDQMAEPTFENTETERWSHELEAALQAKEELTTRGHHTGEVDAEILELKRRLREGGNLRPGDFLSEGRYKLLERIGWGGFGTVWRSYDRSSCDLVAIKVLHGQFRSDQSRRERFFRGSRKMASLQHQGVVRVIEERVEDGGYLFFVMEFVEGGSLDQAILAGVLDQDDCRALLLQAGEALHFAHQASVIHRDLKPSNILLGPGLQAKLTDFDLVLAADSTGGTRTAGILGSVPYTAPEVMENPKEASPQSDIFSLGMTGISLYSGQSLPVRIFRDIDGFVRDLDCPHAVREALGRAASWDKEQRFDSMRAFCEALDKSEPDLSLALAALPESEQINEESPTTEEKLNVQDPMISGRGRSFLPREVMLALAAALATSTLGLALWVGQIQTQLREPQLNMMVEAVYANVRSPESENPVQVPEGVNDFLIIFDTAHVISFPDYQITIKDEFDHEIWSRRGARRDANGEFRLGLSRDFLKEGIYKFELSGIGASNELRSLEEFTVPIIYH